MSTTQLPLPGAEPADVGQQMHDLARRLWPICRSITGDGVRQTLSILREHLPGLAVHEVPTGTQCFDWPVPREWNIRDAYILDPDGRKIVDFKQHNLHVLGYSVPVDRALPLEELQQHLHSLPEQPDAIPYVTSYYVERWGFCLPDRLRRSLRPGTYRAVIDSTLAPGHLSYAELVLPGREPDEVFVPTYICHPSMANNELSGPVVCTFLARRLADRERRFTYRFVFVPETIGSIVYLSRNLEHLRRHVVAGFNVSCVGDERCYSYLASRHGHTLADRVVTHVLRHTDPAYHTYHYLDRGADERQYCAPGVDLPVATVMRSKYGTFPEYHTSRDDLSLITPRGLAGSLQVLERCFACVEANRTYRTPVLCEPQLGRRGLYPTLSTGWMSNAAKAVPDLLAYSDGTQDLLGVAETIGMPLWDLLDIVRSLLRESLLEEVGQRQGGSAAWAGNARRRSA
jgi:aminopeptidase-like protein